MLYHEFDRISGTIVLRNAVQMFMAKPKEHYFRGGGKESLSNWIDW